MYWGSGPVSCPSASPMTGVKLEEKFWEAFNFRIDDGPAPIERRETSPYTGLANRTPMSSTKTNFPPVPEQTSFERSRLSKPAGSTPVASRHASRERGNTYAQLQNQKRKNSGSLTLKVPPSTPFVSSVIAKSMKTPLPQSSTRTHWHLQTPGIKKPTTPALELVSNFLDSISRASEPRTSNPSAPAIRVDENGDVLIMESDIIIDLIEDRERIGLCSPLLEKPRESHLEKLQIPLTPARTAPALRGYELPSAAPASCAEEFHAASWMGWERQHGGQHEVWY